MKIIAIIPFPHQRWYIFMGSFYQLLFPLFLLLTSAWAYPAACILFAAHLFLFPRITRIVLADTLTILKQLVVRKPVI